MRIATYVVVEPSSREDLEGLIFEKIKQHELVPLTVRSIDDELGPREKHIKVGIRQSDHDGLGQHFFSGFFIEDSERYTFNLTIPPWNGEEASVKIAHAPFED